jgi:hypothetical protein
MRAYQIKMLRMLFAIEFFFIAVTTFCRRYVQPRTTALETRLESSDSAQVIRIVGRQIKPRFDLTIGVLRRAGHLGLGDTL